MSGDWSSDVCSSDLGLPAPAPVPVQGHRINQWAGSGSPAVRQCKLIRCAAFLAGALTGADFTAFLTVFSAAAFTVFPAGAVFTAFFAGADFSTVFFVLETVGAVFFTGAFPDTVFVIFWVCFFISAASP